MSNADHTKYLTHSQIKTMLKYYIIWRTTRAIFQALKVFLFHATPIDAKLVKRKEDVGLMYWPNPLGRFGGPNKLSERRKACRIFDKLLLVQWQ